MSFHGRQGKVKSKITVLIEYDNKMEKYNGVNFDPKVKNKRFADVAYLKLLDYLNG